MNDSIPNTIPRFDAEAYFKTLDALDNFRWQGASKNDFWPEVSRRPKPLQSAAERDVLLEQTGGTPKILDGLDALDGDTLKKTFFEAKAPHEQNSLQDLQDTCEERAAILEHEAGLSREWAQAWAFVQTCPKARNWPQEDWDNVLAFVSSLLTGLWMEKLLHHKWTPAEILGQHQYTPHFRFNFFGLLMILSDAKTMHSVSDDKIEVIDRHDVLQPFTRENANPLPW